MINLLADERKDQIRAARVNVILSRYIAIIVMAVAFLLAVLYVSYVVLENTKTKADSIVQSNDVNSDAYKDIKAKADALNTKLIDSKAVLNQQVSYSKFLTTLGQSMPAGTILDSLNLTEESFNGVPMEIKAYAKNSESAAALQAGLQASRLFTVVSIKSTDSANGTDGYPVSVVLTASINRARVQ